ncbi:hypothetical protein NDU88_011490 [Pleurodeles waltl]|uniref:Uncharacterized protein n=1 Tax=Pleurodeles waltl TaxID=8319 RepID=A0AAV7QXE5_PLEWA|nr:hypothetical protein NDU88_011490 [Pleurodeles waltl]
MDLTRYPCRQDREILLATCRRVLNQKPLTPKKRIRDPHCHRANRILTHSMLPLRTDCTQPQNQASRARKPTEELALQSHPTGSKKPLAIETAQQESRSTLGARPHQNHPKRMRALPVRL